MKRPAHFEWSFKFMRLLLFVLIAIVATGLVAEWYLGSTVARSSQPNFERLAEAHDPYAYKHPDSTYGFFLPPSVPGSQDADMGIVTISEGKFRGPGPGARDGRKLAFLVGNSVVFGFAPHDSLTITGFLNRLQDRFFFVNAGVPSWVSRQMRDRILHELISHQPSLIVLWGGYNDASLAFRTTKRGIHFEPGMIESAAPASSIVTRLFEALVPNLSGYLSRRVAGVFGQSFPADTLVASEAAVAFVGYVAEACQASSEAGAAFLAVYQPVLYYHKHWQTDSVSEEARLFFDRFRARSLFEATRAGVPLLDLSSMFDGTYNQIPVFQKGAGRDLGDHVFVDQVHLYVPGSRLAAKAIWRRIARDLSGAQK